MEYYNSLYLSRRLLDEGPVVVTSVTSDASLFAGLFERSNDDATDGIRTTQEKDGMISLSGVIGDILPLSMKIGTCIKNRLLA